MRPVDLKGNLHPWYTQTFDMLTGVPMLVVEDYTYENAGGDPTYSYLRGTLTWGPNNDPTPAKPAHVPRALPGIHNMGGPHLVPAMNLGVPNRTNTGNVILNPVILQLQLDKPTQQWQRLRVLLAPHEAAEVVRLYDEDYWNATTVLTGAGMPADVPIRLAQVIEHTDTVPANGQPTAFYGYRGAVRDLAQRLGRYCSYCEARWQDGESADVEHRAPKAWYPSEYLRWDNFLVACVACNQRFKGDKPTRITGIKAAARNYHPLGTFVPAGTDAAPVSGGGARLPYHDILRAANEFRIWPDLDDGGTTGAPFAANAANPTSYSLRCMRYQLREITGGGAIPIAAVPIADADAVRLDNEQLGTVVNNTVQARVWDPGQAALRVMNVRVEVIARNPVTTVAAFDNRKVAAAGKTIGMVGLNQQAANFGDVRVEARTRAWFSALEMLGLLAEQLDSLQRWQQSWRITRLLRWQLNPPVVNFTDRQWALVCSAAEGGYYSVWIHVFKHFGQAQLGTGALAVQLAQRLHARAAAAPTARWRYHGTNVVNSVVNQIPHL